MYRKRICALLLALLITCVACMAQAATLGYYKARIKGNPKVYSGPGTKYFRGANGKAQYGGGVVRIYGEESIGWLMIGYQNSAGDYRIGYVEPAMKEKIYKAPEGAEPAKLQFAYAQAELNQRATLTDDPVIKATGVVSLPKGRDVTYLATTGRWAYIEVSTKKGTMRGFVKKSAVSMSRSIAESGKESFDVGAASAGTSATAKPKATPRPTATPKPKTLASYAGIPYIGATVYAAGQNAYAVLWAQKQLNQLGYYVPETATLDDDTAGALVDYRARTGLSGSGIDQALIDRQILDLEAMGLPPAQITDTSAIIAKPTMLSAEGLTPQDLRLHTK
ncbi:MAG: hypothetical protein IJ240_02670 [Clostridia bacterium]|nr:hypothetical protein [Clostridia bacterium]